MEILDTAEGRAAPSQETHSSVDRFETVRIFEEREEELKVEAAMALYEKAARARMMPIPQTFRTTPAVRRNGKRHPNG